MKFQLKLLVIVCYNIQITVAYWPPPYEYATKWFDGMPVDHFSFDQNNKTFSMRYLINDTYFDAKDGPIFFYCGNEGDITLFANNTGFMWDSAVPCKAMVVFAEHRYYGETMPYGNESYKKENLVKLTSEQALADFAIFLQWLKSNGTNVKPDTPIIAFGGSYGGMLAAWMRAKYPHLVAGALASSAPVLQFTGLTGCETFANLVSSVFQNSGDDCASCIKESWPTIREYAKTDIGRNKLNKIFRLCKTSYITDEANATQFVEWLTDIWGNTAMINYPYETSFLNPVPAWPVKAMCSKLKGCKQFFNDPDSLLSNVHEALSVFMNFSGNVDCFNFSSSSSSALGDSGWDYQACTEMVMPMCNNESSMFEKSSWNFQNFSDECFDKYGVRPRRDWAVTEYGGSQISSLSNIIFSNGDLDPWSGGGVLHNVSDSVISLMIKYGAHHYDLRGKHPQDTSYVKEARRLEGYYFHKWIMEYKKTYKKMMLKRKS